MNTFLKVLAFIVVLLLVAHFWPVALLPLALAAVATFVFGSLLAGLVALIVGLLVALVVPLLAACLVIATALAPVWIPLLLILCIVKLCRRQPRTA